MQMFIEWFLPKTCRVKVSAVLTRKTFAVGILVIIIVATAMFSVWWTSRPSVTPVSVVDDIGRTVIVEKPPRRIVSVAPSVTEILFALGLHPYKVVGVTYGCDYPPEALKIENISEMRPGLESGPGPAPGDEPFGRIYTEKIVELRPDLVIMERSYDDWQLTWFHRIEEAGLNVVVLWAKSFEDVLRDITLIGEVTWSQEKALKLVSTLRQRVNAVLDKVSGLAEEEKPRVFASAYYDGKHNPWTFGYGYHKPIHFVDEIIKKAGGINVAGSKEGFFDMPLETVIEINPQIILVLDDPRYPAPTYESIMADEKLKNTEAVQNNAVYNIDMRIFVRPGPRLVDAIEETAKMFHPELFG